MLVQWPLFPYSFGKPVPEYQAILIFPAARDDGGGGFGDSLNSSAFFYMSISRITQSCRQILMKFVEGWDMRLETTD